MAGRFDEDDADQAAAKKVIKAAPSVPQAALANRKFMHRVVAWLAQAGVDQFVDVGTGIPTKPNVFEIAREYHPDAVVVGVDNDPLVLAHDRALLKGMPIVSGDVRRVDELIADLDEFIDWDRPVGVLLLAVLHFVTDEQDPAGIVRAFTGRMVPGSMVALSHLSSTGPKPVAVAQIEKLYRDETTAPGVARTHEQITNLFGRLGLVPPGVVPVQHWPCESGLLTDVPVLGGSAWCPTRWRIRLAEHWRGAAVAELPDEQDAGTDGWAGDGPDEAEVWAQRVGWWLACLTVWGLAPLWVPGPVRWACQRRRRGGRRDG
ncbi:SAM-dependent methyltransferase [Actinomadura sp. 9N215]|uniref:SAM-dependent methyltransferase n=1 Tax=Actinomadura sp. 9N215 TaxID=3375150 RepID=UPI003794E431